MLDNSMGATVGDYDLDGKLDVLFTSTSITNTDLQSLNSVARTAGMILNFRGNHLYKNLGGRVFEDVTSSTGIRESGWGWGAFMFDFDNDGDLDAFNGNGMDDPETTDDDFAVNQRARLYVNQGVDESFHMVDEAFVRGIADVGDNRGAMTLDYDKDGDLDIVLINHGAEMKLYRNNNANYNDYLKVYVYEAGGRVSVGAKVWVQLFGDDDGDGLTYLREIRSNAAFLGQSEVYAHFGFGKISSMATMIGKSEDKILIYNVTVMWPIVNGKQYVESYLGNIPLRSEISVRRPSLHYGHERVIHHVYNGRAALNISCGKNS